MKTTYIFLAFIAILGYNAFLIQRDQALFDNRETLKERYCAVASHRNHPDCVVE